MENKKIDKNTLAWLWKNSGKCKISIFMLILISCATGLIGVFFAWFFRGIVDSAVAQSITGFWLYAISLVALVLINLLLGALSRYLAENTTANIENILKLRLFKTIISKDYSSVTATHSGEWMNRLTSDTVVVAGGLTSILPNVAGMITQLVGALFSMLILVPEFVYILIPAGLFIIFVTYIFRKKLKQLHKNIQEADGKLRSFMTERLSSLLIVRAFVKEKNTCEGASKRMKNHKAKRMQRLFFSNVSNIGFGIAISGTYIFSAIYCGHGILIGTITYGTFVAVLQLVNQIQLPFANITGYLPQYYATIASAERLIEVETYEDDTEKEFKTKEQIRDFYDKDFKSISLKNVNFSYDKAPVLENKNLTINKGQHVVFTGVSGCGKSTILKLLMSIYKPISGQCLINDDITITSEYRRLFSYVPQGNALMSGTIKQAVAFGDKDLYNNEEAIWKALEIACAKDFILSLDQKLGEWGTGLSEGQLQRISIARAIASGAPILLLDECTSSLDLQTEEKLLKNLRSMTDKTVIIVTHRTKALDMCDKEYKI